jgi:enoyl-CoA hydratase/carnithine racemase
MSNNPVIYIKKDHIGHITLNRPEAGNAIDFSLAQELAEICLQINQDEDIYIVLVSGAGDMFCSGADESYSVSLNDESR